jgi:hypothetical protein
MNRIYKPQHPADNSGIPFKRTPGGLQVIDLADVVPVLDAYTRNDGHGLAVWYQYCSRWHVHGRGGGRRFAHCLKASPYVKAGYVLNPIGKPVPTFKNGRVRPLDSGIRV